MFSPIKPKRTFFGLTFVIAALMAGQLNVSSAIASDFCWSSQQLRYAEGDEHIRKDATVTPIPPPTGEAIPAPSGFVPISGAVRRVTLPRGAPKLVALTFDLCEQPNEVAGYQGTLVDYLRDNSIKATFFTGGKWMLSHQKRAQQLMADPLFEVANHSWGHRNLRTVTALRRDEEIRSPQIAYEILRRDLSRYQCLASNGRDVQRTVRPRMSLFRFPFGACDAKAIEAVGQNGLIPIQWDVSSGDPDKRLTASEMVSGVVSKVRPGSIVLFHANGRGWRTAEALPKIVAALARSQFEFVTVSELLQYPGAKWEITPDCYDARPGDTDRYDKLSYALEAQYERFLTRTTVEGREQAGRIPRPKSDTAAPK